MASRSVARSIANVPAPITAAPCYSATPTAEDTLDATAYPGLYERFLSLLFWMKGISLNSCWGIP